jgi:tyrosyl-tRNA synthetase
MSATKPDFNLDLQDGMKKVRQKIAKSFCEPGNLIGNVALELCKNFIFPFYKHQMQDIAVVDSDNIKGKQ